MFYFELKCFKYCLGDSTFTHDISIYCVVTKTMNTNGCHVMTAESRVPEAF